MSLFTPGFRLLDGEDINKALNGATPFAIQSSVAGSLTAAGTTRATALALTKEINVIGTAAASSGVVLPAASTVGIGGRMVVFNNGDNAMKVYAAGDDKIDGTAGSTGVTLTNDKRCEYIVTGDGDFISAQLGATSA